MFLFLAVVVFRIEVPEKSLGSQFEEKTIVIKAEHYASAYGFVFDFGKSGETTFINEDGLRVEWIFEGITVLKTIHLSDNIFEISSVLKEYYNPFQIDDLNKKIIRVRELS